MSVAWPLSAGSYVRMAHLGYTDFGIGVSDDGNNWQMWGNNGDWYPQGNPLQPGPVSSPVSSHSTHIITLYHETMTDTVDGQIFTSDQIWWWNRGNVLTDACVFWEGNYDHPWYFNRCRIMVHATGEVLFDVIPLKSSSDGKAYFYDLVGKTLKTNSYGTLTPQDTNPYTVEIGGRMYPIVTIGNQVWLAENLDYKFSGCDIGPTGSPTMPAAWYYNNDEATYGVNGNKYGLLYNWYAADYLNQHLLELGIPAGWRVPSYSDYNSLYDYSSGIGNFSAVLKSTYGWNSGGNGTDNLGFSAFPAGGYNTESFIGVGDDTSMWQSTEVSVGGTRAYVMYLSKSNSSSSINNSTYKNRACSLRLVKDAT